jgi:hypothetical protein
VSKKDQREGYPPCEVVLTGPTATDPRARQAIEAQAATISKFQRTSRDSALNGDLAQQVRNGLTADGIRMRHIWNNGQETLLLQVPLVDTSGGSETTSQGQRKLVIEVMFPAVPYETEQATTPPNEVHWTELDLEVRHAQLWQSGLVMSLADGTTVDVTSSPEYGADQGAGHGLYSAGKLPPRVKDADPLGSITLMHDPAELHVVEGQPVNNPFTGAPSAAACYVSYIVNSYLFVPPSGQPVSFDVFIGQANMTALTPLEN